MAEPKVLTEEALKLAREIVSYSESNLAKNIGACQPGTFGFNALIVAKALIERLEPVNPTPCNDWRMSQKCGECKRLLYANGGSNPKYCPNCGKAIRWA